MYHDLALLSPLQVPNARLYLEAYLLADSLCQNEAPPGMTLPKQTQDSPVTIELTDFGTACKWQRAMLFCGKIFLVVSCKRHLAVGIRALCWAGSPAL
jgi:hypothetical protein